MRPEALNASSRDMPPLCRLDTKKASAICVVSDLPRPFAVRHNSRMAKQRHFIRQWRKHRELTQDQLAERVGINRAHLSRVETNGREPDLALLELLADALRCDVADLIIRDPSDPAGLWSIYDALTVQQRVQLVAIGETLKKTG